MFDRIAASAMVLLALTFAGSCSNPLGRQYEYEEQLYLGVNGAATLVIDSSVPALVALHGAPLDPALHARVERDQIRALFVAAQCPDVRVGQPWIRRGRRFVQVRIATPDVMRLKSCGILSWATYAFSRDGKLLHFEQELGASAAGNPGAVNWDGSELVAFKLHLPSRIVFHNVKRLETGANGEPDRGNILTWEQRLSDRRAGQPLRMEVRMDSESILYRTLWLFAGAFGAAVAVLATLIWITISRAKRRHAVAAGRRLPSG
ncbi:MAG: hypothetical protein ABI051_05265 [Vicinamibacterales bacterium]